MGFFDSILGRTRLPKTKEENIFAMSTAVVSLEASGLHFRNSAGVLFKKFPSGRFKQIVDSLREMLSIGGSDFNVSLKEVADNLGFDWLVLFGQMQDILTVAHSISQSMKEQALDDTLLACAFAFESEGRKVYWIYNFKNGTFYPFVPLADKKRDNQEELRLASVYKTELPIEPKLESWYALWDPPLEPSSS